MIKYNGSDHWLTISTIGARQDEVFIFDSLYCSVSQSVKNQIAAILATTSKRIQLNFVSVQKQSGGCDCGLFTLAFATTLVSGHNPGHYVFDQRKMRKHLYKCLDKGHMEMFPHKEVQSHSKIASIDYILCVQDAGNQWSGYGGMSLVPLMILLYSILIVVWLIIQSC